MARPPLRVMGIDKEGWRVWLPVRKRKAWEKFRYCKLMQRLRCTDFIAYFTLGGPFLLDHVTKKDRQGTLGFPINRHTISGR